MLNHRVIFHNSQGINFLSFYSLIIVGSIIYLNWDSFPLSTYKLFDLYTFLGEDAAQLMNSVSLFYNNEINLKLIGKSLYSPFIDFISFLITIIFKFLSVEAYKGIVLASCIVYFLPIIFLNYATIQTIENNNISNLLDKLLILFIVNLLISPSIVAGHANLLYSLSMMYFAIIHYQNLYKRYIFYTFAVLSWYPSLVLVIILMAEPILTALKIDKKIQFTKISTYFSILITIFTTVTVYLFVKVSTEKSDWKFELLREEGGNPSIPTIFTFLLFTISLTVITLNEKHSLRLNTKPIFLISLSYLIFYFYNIFIIATSYTYAISKLNVFYHLLISLILITFYKDIREKINLPITIKFLVIFVVILTLNFQTSINSFIALYSKSNLNSQIGINKKQFKKISSLLDSDYDYFTINYDYTKDQNIDSYLASRWISSYFGKDDRKLNKQMGWRFSLLRRINYEEFLEKSKDKKYNYLLLTKNDIIEIDSRLVREILSQ